MTVSIVARCSSDRSVLLMARRLARTCAFGYRCRHLDQSQRLQSAQLYLWVLLSASVAVVVRTLGEEDMKKYSIALMAGASASGLRDACTGV